MFIAAVPIIKLFAWGEGDSGGHMLREKTSRGLCGLVCPSRTSKRGGEGDCVKEGGGGEGVQEGPLAKILERQRVQQAAADAAKKLADATKRYHAYPSGI